MKETSTLANFVSRRTGRPSKKETHVLWKETYEEDKRDKQLVAFGFIQ